MDQPFRLSAQAAYGAFRLAKSKYNEHQFRAFFLQNRQDLAYLFPPKIRLVLQHHHADELCRRLDMAGAQQDRRQLSLNNIDYFPARSFIYISSI